MFNKYSIGNTNAILCDCNEKDIRELFVEFIFGIIKITKLSYNDVM